MKKEIMKQYLVTGASRGIGKATALKLLGQGSKVIGAYHVSEAAARQLEAEHENLKMLQVDLTNRQSTLAFIDALKDYKLDGIVNNAGIFEEEDWL